VVDDDAAVREAVSAALATKYVVHTAASGTDACVILQTHPVAVIILDALLRHEHGLDLVERFRRLSSAHIVILTGHGTEDLAVRALRARVSEYLKKPVSVAELLAVLGRLIPERPRLVDTVARARRYLDEFPAKPFRTAELASRLGVSETHLRRLFRAAQGQTLRQYLAEVRVRRAAQFLERDGRSVKEVALDVGFADMRLFRRTFARHFGMTPVAWQRRHSEKRATLRSDLP
jgi:YesN/AraC family two-component response regulator